MKKCRLEILGVSETKMKGNRSTVVGKARCVIMGVEEGSAKAGSLYCMAENFGRNSFWRIAEISVFGGINFDGLATSVS